MDSIFRPAARLLSEADRARLTTMLRRLIDAIEGDLRAALALPIGPRAAFARLDGAPFAADAALATAMLQRLDECRFADATARPGLDHADPDLLAAYIAAAGRRIDPLGEPLLPVTDLPAAIQAQLAWRVADLLEPEVRAADAAMTREAVDALCRRYADIGSLDAAALALVEGAALDARSALPALILDGHVRIVAAWFARRIDVPLDVAMRGLLDPAARLLPALLRATDLDRKAAAGLLAACFTRPGADFDAAASARIISALRDYDACEPAAARRTLDRAARAQREDGAPRAR